jgi:PPOX class probable F420-dependent enzyme
MTGPEASDFLAAHRKMQLATIGKDGAPHLVTMFYAVVDGRIAFWTYRASQKARNMQRDHRVTCLVEDGVDYFELQGVQVRGRVEIVDDPAEVLRIGGAIAAGLSGIRRRAATTTSHTPRASGWVTTSSPRTSAPGITASCCPEPVPGSPRGRRVAPRRRAAGSTRR